MDKEKYLAQRRSEIAHNIRKLRQYNGWSQQQVADYLACSRRRVCRVESEHVEFAVAELELLAQAFRVPLAQLLASAA